MTRRIHARANLMVGLIATVILIMAVAFDWRLLIISSILHAGVIIFGIIFLIKGNRHDTHHPD
jgi:hypothetical protein